MANKKRIRDLKLYTRKINVVELTPNYRVKISID